MWAVGGGLALPSRKDSTPGWVTLSPVKLLEPQAQVAGLSTRTQFKVADALNMPLLTLLLTWFGR